MFVKQIDQNTALKLAAMGHDIQVLAPKIPDPEKWTDYDTDTLQNLLDGCLFFRREPAMEKPEFEDILQRPDKENPPPGADGSDTGDSVSAEGTPGKRVGAGAARKQKPVDTGKLLALHNAGWSNVKIADELGISDVTVGKYLKRMREEGNGTINT